MNGNREAAEGWLRKAESDLANAELCITAGTALDTACFHCQQAAEKALKAWLMAHDQPFPFRHDLEELIPLGIYLLLPTYRTSRGLTPTASMIHASLRQGPALQKIRP